MTPELAAELAESQNATDVGLRCRHFPTLDIDCTDQKLVAAMLGALRFVVKRLGGAPIVRAREKTEKRALVFRLKDDAQPFRKRLLIFRPADPASGLDPFRIELLADGQQVKIAGNHPETGTSYLPSHRGRSFSSSWDWTDVSYIDERDADAILEAVRNAVLADGRYVVGKSGVGGVRGTRRPLGQNPADQGSQSSVSVLVEAISPNTVDRYPGYEDALTVCAAIAGASGGAEWGRDLWVEFACGEDSEWANTPDWALERWQSFVEGGSELGLDWLIHMAGDCGLGPDALRKVRVDQSRSSGVFEAVEDRSGDLPIRRGEIITAKQIVSYITSGRGEDLISDRGMTRRGWPGRADLPVRIEKPSDFFKRFIQVRSTAQFIDRRTGEVLRTEDAMQGMLGSHGIATHAVLEKTNAKGELVGYRKIWPWAVGRAELISVSELKYWPGYPEFFEGDRGKVVFNTWRPHSALADALDRAEELSEAAEAGGAGGTGRVEPEQVWWWLRLVKHLFADCDGGVPAQIIAGRFLDWAAYLVGYPENKPGHQYLISSPIQGVGKSMMAECLALALGKSNACTVEGSVVAAGWNLHARSKLAIVEELMDRGTHREARATYNRLKTQLSPYPHEIQINQKFEPIMHARNSAGWLGFSNHDTEALAVDPNERRLVILILTADRLPADIARDVISAMADPKKISLLTRWLAERAVLDLPKVERDWVGPDDDGSGGGQVRLEIVEGNAWHTEAKQETIDASGGAVAQWVLQKIAMGEWPDITTADHVLAYMRTHPLWAARGAQLTPALIGTSLHEAGLVRLGRGQQFRVEGQRFRLWATESGAKQFKGCEKYHRGLQKFLFDSLENAGKFEK
ncbi:MAG: primase-helicase family protein [Pseudomonadota bacterium]